MTRTNRLEESLDDIFARGAPRLPEGVRKALVAWAPALTLILGILSLVSAWGLWHWARTVSDLANYANSLCTTYSGVLCGVVPSPFTVWLWLGVAVLTAEGILYALACLGLRDRAKRGWNYVYYALWLQVVYAVVSLFISYNRASHFIGSLIAAAIGFYLLFQIRGAYQGGKRKRQAPTPAGRKDS
ncbi:MAG TPA: hypothetical protein VGM08_02795 [Candidatus Saccharimonadales bacterium]|jgi:hypothetical protein